MRTSVILAGLFLIATFGASQASADAPLYGSCTVTPTSAGVYGSCQIGHQNPIPIQAGCDTCAPLWVGPTCTVDVYWTNSGAGCT
ncbi:MAG: hypothetical protein V4510_10285 [bacterium]